MKSSLHEREPDVTNETQVTARSKLVESYGYDYKPASVIDYYFGLRTVCNAWALGGNYEVDSKLHKDERVLMMPYSTAIDYADRVLRITAAAEIPNHEKLAWMSRKDTITRKMMAALVRKKWPAGEALEEALAVARETLRIYKANGACTSSFASALLRRCMHVDALLSSVKA